MRLFSKTRGSWLRGSKAGKCFLATRLGAENPDVVVSTARGKR